MFATEMLQGWDEILLSGSANIALKKEKYCLSHPGALQMC